MRAHSLIGLAFAVLVVAGCSPGEQGAGGQVPPPASDGAIPTEAAPSESATAGSERGGIGGAGGNREGGGEGAGSCGGVADQVIAQVNQVVEQSRDRSLGDLLSGGLIEPDQQQRLQRLQRQAQQSGCAPRELEQLLRDRADQIGGDGPVSNLVRDALRSGGQLPF